MSVSAKPLSLIYNEKSGFHAANKDEIYEPLMTNLTAYGYEIQAFEISAETDFSSFMDRIIARHLQAEEIAYIGDDLIDLPIMNRVGFAAAVNNAVAEVKAIAHVVSARSGGDGAVREILEFIMKAQDFWDKMIQEYSEMPAWENIEQ